ncbi:MAG: diacylglycerol/lipid kinase family protein [Bacteroidales bacterium]
MKENKNEHICFIINPVSGGKKKEHLRKWIIEAFENEDKNVQIYFTGYPGHASELANKLLQEEVDIIVAVGGDGTINEIARVLIEQDVKLAIIPYGSGNGFARHFGFPLDPDASLQILKEGITRKIDVGMANDQPFFCTSGLGFDAETGYHFSHFGKRGFLSYAFSFLRVFKSYKALKYLIKINDISIERDAFFINVANISQFGYNFKIAPDASTEDGFLDLVIVNKFPKWKGPWMAIQSLTGNIHKNPYVEYHKAIEIQIDIKSNYNHIHIDGEPGTGSGKMKYTINPSCLEVILPVAKS